MAQLTMPRATYQTLPSDSYAMKYVGDEIVEVDEYDFDTGQPTGNRIRKLKVSLGVDGVEDERSRNSVFVFTQLFTLSLHERAALPKFLAAVRIPMPKEATEIDTDPAIGRWVTAQVEQYTKKSGQPGNRVTAWVADKSRKPSTPLTTVAADAQWDDEGPAADDAPPF